MPRLSPVDRVRVLVLRSANALPSRVVRRLAGRPFLTDGATLSAQSQLILRLQRVALEPAARAPDPGGPGRPLRQSSMVGGTQRIGEVQERTVRGAEEPLAARLYVPTDAASVTPMLVFFHGGGMIYGDLEATTPVPLRRRALRRTGAAVDSRLAAEYCFPAGVDDACAAFAWISDRAADSVRTRSGSRSGRLGRRLPRCGRPRSGLPRRAGPLAFQVLVTR